MSTAPALESRFLKPGGWQWQRFTRDDRNVRFGYFAPEKPDANIILLPGLNEFGEKYFEVAHELISKNYGVYVIDWFGQGGSKRFLKNPLKRHSDDFSSYVLDLHHMIKMHVKSDAPMIMLAHSMGGNIGLRYLYEYPETFKSAAFTAPMCGIHALKAFPTVVLNVLSATLNATLGSVFTSLHGKNSRRQNRNFNGNPLTSDPVRFTLMNHWMTTKSELESGDVTFGWVYHALRSCAYLATIADNIKTSCLFAIAEHERITDNDATRFITEQMPHAKVIEIGDALHEIMMERDELRSVFFDQFHSFVTAQISTS